MPDQYVIRKPEPGDIDGTTVRFPVELESGGSPGYDSFLDTIARDHGTQVIAESGRALLLVPVREGASLQDVANAAKRVIDAANERYQKDMEKSQQEDTEREQKRREGEARSLDLRSQLDDLQI